MLELSGESGGVYEYAAASNFLGIDSRHKGYDELAKP